MVMLVILIILAVDMDVGMDVGMLVAVNVVSVGVFVVMGMSVHVGVLQLDGVFNHKISTENHNC